MSSSSSAVSRLPYSLHSVSSSDGIHSSLSSPHGWQSGRQCSYPQTLLLWFGGLCEVRKVQLLSHQSKIARTVELYAGNRKDKQQQGGQGGRDGRADGAEWSRLGFFSLDANEKSAYKARELKVSLPPTAMHLSPISHFITSASEHRDLTHDSSLPVLCCVQSVPLSCQCEWLRVVLKACHVNPLNADRQVGIVALHVMGQQIGPTAAAFASSGQHSPDAPSSSLSSPPYSLLHGSSDIPSDLDVSTAQYLSHLQQLKAAAIDAEDFDAAKQMKARIDRLLGVVPSIVECERRKREAIAREDYDEAKQCKKEADRLREAALKDRPVGGVAEERKDMAEPLSQRGGKRRESRNVVDMPQLDGQLQQAKQAVPVQALADDDRPIRPAKQQSESAAVGASASSISPVTADDRPLGKRSAKAADPAQPASSDDDKSDQHRTRCSGAIKTYGDLNSALLYFICCVCSSFPVSHAAMDERPLRPVKARKAAADEQQPLTGQSSRTLA